MVTLLSWPINFGSIFGMVPEILSPDEFCTCCGVLAGAAGAFPSVLEDIIGFGSGWFNSPCVSRGNAPETAGVLIEANGDGFFSGVVGLLIYLAEAD